MNKCKILITGMSLALTGMCAANALVDCERSYAMQCCYYRDEANNKCEPLPEGYLWKDDLERLLALAPGECLESYYTTRNMDASELTVCPKGYRCTLLVPPFAGGGLCKCPAGSTTSGTGAVLVSDCNICESGYEYNGSACVINSCPAGQTLDSAGTACTECAVGTYKSTTTTAACTSCGTGKTTANTGSTSSADCICAAGYGGSSCTICAKGSYKSTTGSADCTSCGTGKTTASTGSTSESKCVCDAGYGGSACKICAKGTYKSATGSAACTGCGTGKTTAGTGATSSTDCICAEGYGGASCTICSIGTYKSATGTSTCISCGAGKTTADTGSTDASACICAAGYGGSSCTICPIGTYKSATGPAECTPCPNNGTTETTGATSESQCIATTPKLCEAGATMLHVGDYVFNLYPDEVCERPAIHIGLDNGVCCAKLEKGEGVNALHVRYNDEVYHTVN